MNPRTRNRRFPRHPLPCRWCCHGIPGAEKGKEVHPGLMIQPDLARISTIMFNTKKTASKTIVEYITKQCNKSEILNLISRIKFHDVGRLHIFADMHIYYTYKIKCKMRTIIYTIIIYIIR